MPKGKYPRGPMKGTIQNDGYRYFLFNRQGEPVRRIAEQRLVWEQNYGPVPDGMVVHHKDENKLNNDIENLSLMAAGEHVRMHRREGLGYEIRDGVEHKPCRDCNEILPLTDFYKKPSGKNSTSHHWCCKPCYNKRTTERRRITHVPA